MQAGDRFRELEPRLSAETVGTARRLLSPTTPCTFRELSLQWRHKVITVVAHRPRDFDDGPSLPARIRGAWGRALFMLAIEGRSPRPGAPSAAATFFGDMGDWCHGLPLPKPFTIQVDCRGETLIVQLIIFGFATFWLNDAVEALLRSLQGGINLRFGSPVRASIVPESYKVTDVESLLPSPRAYEARLFFQTPLCIRRDQTLQLDGASVLLSLAHRVAGMARWQDVAVDQQLSAMKKKILDLKIDMGEMELRTWDHFSSRRPGLPTPLNGLIGSMSVCGDLGDVLPILAMGQSCHVGSRASLGLGRYQFVAVG